MSFCKNFNELFIKPEDEGEIWQNKVFELFEKGDIKGLYNHLDTSNELYQLEKQLYTALNAFTLKTKSKKEKEKLLKGLKNDDFIKSVKYTDEAIRIQVKNGVEIKATKLSGLIPNLKFEDEDIETESRRGDCHTKSIKISKSMGMPNDVVTGYIYGLSEKARFLHSWVEFKLNGKEMVIDYTLNILMNKEGYYYVQHAEPLSRISDEDLVNDDEYIRKFNKLGYFNIKEYLAFRDEIIKDFKKNQKIFDEER